MALSFCFLVLVIGYLFHPIHNFTVEVLLDRDVRHCRGRCGAMPMFFPGREPDDITRPDLFDRSTLTLGPAAPGRNDERLAQRMRMPGRTGAGFEGNACAGPARGGFGLEKRVDAYDAGEPVGGSF